MIRGQYRGYREEDGVDPGSDVETYVALRLEIDSWRWAGVPFLIRTGKHLPVTATEAVVEFNAPPRLLFSPPGAPAPHPNHLRFRLGKDDGVMLHLQTKAPGDELRQPAGRPRGELRRGVRRAAGGLPAAARGRDGRRHPPLRPRRRARSSSGGSSSRPSPTRTR